MDFVDISLIFPDNTKSKFIDINKMDDTYEEQEICYEDEEQEVVNDDIEYEEYETLAEQEEDHPAKYMMTEDGKLICMKSKKNYHPPNF